MRMTLAALAALGVLALVALGPAGGSRPRGPAREPGPPWGPHLHAVDEALGRGDRSAAVRAWQAAHAMAPGARSWVGLIETRQGALRIGDATGSRRAGGARAREACLAGLFRARAAGSVDGVLQAVEAFATLGDRQVAARGLRIAAALAEQRGDAGAAPRVRAAERRLAAELATLPPCHADATREGRAGGPWSPGGRRGSARAAPAKEHRAGRPAVVGRATEALT